MAVYRQIQISFWQDPFIENLSSLEKYFYIYLLTNSKTTQCGCYEISNKLIKYETGLSDNQINEFIKNFEKEKKIIFSKETNEIFILNWLKHNSFKSPKVLTCIKKELEKIKNRKFLDYINSILNQEITIDRLLIDYKNTIYKGSQKEEEEEKTKKEEKTETKEEEITKKEEKTETKDTLKTLWNDICISLPKILNISETRNKKIKLRFAEIKDIEVFKQAFLKIEKSNFCKGENKNNWKASFDWIIDNDTNIFKVLEGKYDNKKDYWDKIEEEGDKIDRRNIQRDNEEFMPIL